MGGYKIQDVKRIEDQARPEYTVVLMPCEMGSNIKEFNTRTIDWRDGLKTEESFREELA